MNCWPIVRDTIILAHSPHIKRHCYDGLFTQVMHQAEQIEQLYSQAVRATVNIDSGNVHLKKAIRHNASARLYVLVLLLVASFGLLFLDWWTTRRA